HEQVHVTLLLHAPRRHAGYAVLHGSIERRQPHLVTHAVGMLEGYPVIPPVNLSGFTDREVFDLVSHPRVRRCADAVLGAFEFPAVDSAASPVTRVGGVEGESTLPLEGEVESYIKRAQNPTSLSSNSHQHLE